MTKKDNELIQQVHQGFFGVPGTEEKGMVGDVKEIKQSIQEHGEAIAVLKAQRKLSRKEQGGVVAVVTAVIVALWKSFTGQ